MNHLAIAATPKRGKTPEEASRDSSFGRRTWAREKRWDPNPTRGEPRLAWAVENEDTGRNFWARSSNQTVCKSKQKIINQPVQSEIKRNDFSLQFKAWFQPIYGGHHPPFFIWLLKMKSRTWHTNPTLGTSKWNVEKWQGVSTL
jgi:hypothetical protein